MHWPAVFIFLFHMCPREAYPVAWGSSTVASAQRPQEAHDGQQVAVGVLAAADSVLAGTTLWASISMRPQRAHHHRHCGTQQASARPLL